MQIKYTVLRVIPGGAREAARLDAERWIDEARSFDAAAESG
jgi:hypothetical protein